jgi:hypothetical protein
MRWPNRHPHSLTPGMRIAQRGLAGFLPLIDFRRFYRRNLNEETVISNPAVKAVASGDASQAIAWLIRTDTIGENGMLNRDAAPIGVRLQIPGLDGGCYTVTTWDTVNGREIGRFEASLPGAIEVPALVDDLAVAVVRSDR